MATRADKAETYTAPKIDRGMELRLPDEDADCMTCGGDGLCPDCGGDPADNDTYHTDCRKCRGNGSCPRCHGTGWRTHRDGYDHFWNDREGRGY